MQSPQWISRLAQRVFTNAIIPAEAVVALSRCLGSLAVLLAGVDGARISKKRAAAQPIDVRSKFIAGVPVLNYHTAYEGESSLGASDGELAGEWVVVVKAGTTNAQMQRLCKTAPYGCNLMGHPQGGVPFCELRATENDLEKLVHSAKGLIDFIEPDQTVHMIPEIKSPSVEARTWGLNRIGADSRGSTGVGATVFVLDTGVRSSHNEFGGRAASALDMSSGSLRECNGDVNCAADGQGHGTHCAGTAAGETFGVAPGAAVRSVKVLSDSGSGSWSWSYEALDWLAAGTAKDVRPAVASMSLGGPGSQQAMRKAVDAAVNSGVVVVVAGGNSNTDACNFSPAFVPSAITVGSTTSEDKRSSFSNYGSCTDIWAPGSSVESAAHTSDSGSATFSGTSMACPHVSGGAALLLGVDPSKSPATVVQNLLEKAALNVISDLRAGDTNALLWVGEGSAPTPAPTPAPPPGWSVTGAGCRMTGNCIESLNHPGNYGNNEACSITAQEVDITVSAFNTESGYDFLIMGGRSYSGTSGPSSGPFSGTISWSSDYSVTKSGWKLCKA